MQTHVNYKMVFIFRSITAQQTFVAHTKTLIMLLISVIIHNFMGNYIFHIHRKANEQNSTRQMHQQKPIQTTN